MTERDAAVEFADSLQLLNRYLRRHEAVSGNGRNATRVQAMILRHINRSGECTIGQLAERLDVRSSTMSQMIDRLELARWVCRVQDAQDARVRLVRLTDEGLAVIEHLRETKRELLANLFLDLTAEEREILTGLMGKLVRQIPGREH